MMIRTLVFVGAGAIALSFLAGCATIEEVETHGQDRASAISEVETETEGEDGTAAAIEETEEETHHQ